MGDGAQWVASAILVRVRAGRALARPSRSGSYTGMSPYDDDDDWVGEPPEGRYTRDRAKPDFWRQPWPLAGLGAGLLVVIVVVIVIVAH
jgi:hypothetical protein